MSVFFGLLGARFSEFSPQGNPSVCHGRQLPLHRGAMGSRCPPGVDRLVFSLIGRRCFGGRGALRSPLSPHRNAPSGHSGVAHGLFYDQAILWLDLQNAHAPGSLRSPSDAAPECFFKTSRCSGRLIFRFRTDPPFGAPVFRSAYSASRNARAPAASPAFGGRGERSSPLHPPLPPPGCAARMLWTSGERAPQGGRQIKRNARVFLAFLLLYSVVRSADRTGFPDARRSGGAGGRRRQRARRSRRRRG